MQVYVYAVEGDALREVAQLEKHRGPITCVRYSAHGMMIASTDSNREVVVWDRATKQVRSLNPNI